MNKQARKQRAGVSEGGCHMCRNLFFSMYS